MIHTQRETHKPKPEQTQLILLQTNVQRKVSIYKRILKLEKVSLFSSSFAFHIAIALSELENRFPIHGSQLVD